VTDQALRWAELLRGWGHDGEIVAEHVHPKLSGRVRALDDGGAEVLASGAVVLRYSIWSRVVDAAAAADGPLGVVYHNVTPGELLRSVNPSVAALCDRARQSLGLLRGLPTVVIADSSFNAAEAEQAGLTPATVVPLLLDLPATVAAGRPPSPEPVILYVGRLAPNKRVEDAISAFALYQRHRAPSASLVLIGSDSAFEPYGQALVDLTEELGVRNVRFAGHVPDQERDAWYRRADAFLSLSVHEGFGAPLVEALAHGLPVVARDAGAVPETLGGAGIVLDADDLALVAEALHEVATSETTRRGLRAAARRRLAELQPDVVGERIRTALRPLLEAA
jgi:glycosyltransferase involved in cell wall biosynthesis